MKGTLEFNLPEEEEQFKTAQNGQDWNSVVYELENKLRGWEKHGHEFKTADQAIEAIRKLLWDEIKDRNLELY